MRRFVNGISASGTVFKTPCAAAAAAAAAVRNGNSERFERMQSVPFFVANFHGDNLYMGEVS